MDPLAGELFGRSDDLICGVFGFLEFQKRVILTVVKPT